MPNSNNQTLDIIYQIERVKIRYKILDIKYQTVKNQMLDIRYQMLWTRQSQSWAHSGLSRTKGEQFINSNQLRKTKIILSLSLINNMKY